ncbi:LysR family transcriptional regulator [Gluconacetobacter sacchari]|uniref:LysR family transcriptional regulator n=2 Tax=Gluconacetobacter sacchari TaxID=92759 RepID=A0A7W4IBM6_9PROT|nr:LysR family transcriptional regulator [Gluconacetobacter sacchari]MBB2159894.1 LysR family transcriptional regulator [Gluconacetobacter sacchari]
MNFFQTMSVFVAVVETGSMTAAAERSGISTTMVGNHVRQLEEHLGASLLRRTTRRQSLTPFGAAYYEKCLHILALVSETEQMAQSLQSIPSGTLRITAPVTYGSENVTSCVAAFLIAHPEVEVELILSERSVDLVEEKFDLAIRLGEPEPSNLVSRRLTDNRMVLCAAPAYLARRGEPRTIGQLASHDGLCFAYTARSPWHWARREWRFEGPRGPVCVEMRRRALANSTQALRRAALEGAGIAMLPATLVGPDLETGRLRAVLPTATLPSRPIYLLYHRERHHAPALRSFIRFALRTLGAQTELLA